MNRKRDPSLPRGDPFQDESRFRHDLECLVQANRQLAREVKQLVVALHEVHDRLTMIEGPSVLPAELFDYVEFEDRFRGSSAVIRKRQTMYVDLFLGRAPVVDLGSGRGEFVALLTEHGIHVTGIDHNAEMVASCQRRGLNVLRADMFDYLAGLADGSLDGVAMLQVVEHLSPGHIAKLIALCGSKLKPEAPIVAETPNPLSATAMGNFYLDPTHIRPVPPQLLRFLFEQGPFDVERVRFSAPVSTEAVDEVLDVAAELPEETRLYQDYAVISKRR